MTTGVLLVVNFHYHCGSPSICQDTVANDTTGCQRPAGPGHLKTGPLDHWTMLFHVVDSSVFYIFVPSSNFLSFSDFAFQQNRHPSPLDDPKIISFTTGLESPCMQSLEPQFFRNSGEALQPCTTEDVFSEACSAHHRRICGSLQEQTSETGH